MSLPSASQSEFSAKSLYPDKGFEKTLQTIASSNLDPGEKNYQVALLIEQAVNDSKLLLKGGTTPKRLFECAVQNLTESSEDSGDKTIRSKVFAKIYEKALLYGDQTTTNAAVKEIKDIRILENLKFFLEANMYAEPIFSITDSSTTRNFYTLDELFLSNSSVTALLTAGMGSRASDGSEMQDEYLGMIISKIIQEKSLLDLSSEDLRYLCRVIEHRFDELSPFYIRIRSELKAKLTSEYRSKETSTSDDLEIKRKLTSTSFVNKLLLDVLADLFESESKLFALESFYKACAYPGQKAKFAVEIAMRMGDLETFSLYLPSIKENDSFEFARYKYNATWLKQPYLEKTRDAVTEELKSQLSHLAPDAFKKNVVNKLQTKNLPKTLRDNFTAEEIKRFKEEILSNLSMDLLNMSEFDKAKQIISLIKDETTREMYQEMLKNQIVFAQIVSNHSSFSLNDSLDYDLFIETLKLYHRLTDEKLYFTWIRKFEDLVRSHLEADLVTIFDESQEEDRSKLLQILVNLETFSKNTNITLETLAQTEELIHDLESEPLKEQLLKKLKPIENEYVGKLSREFISTLSASEASSGKQVMKAIKKREAQLKKTDVKDITITKFRDTALFYFITVQIENFGSSWSAAELLKLSKNINDESLREFAEGKIDDFAKHGRVYSSYAENDL